jgi:NADPH-ferrihemoprotein reductase
MRFFKRKTHPESLLTGKFSYTVLGLGDSNLLLDRQTTTAKDCNRCAQELDARLEALGAQRLYPMGIADERTGLEEVETWVEGLWARLEG